MSTNAPGTNQWDAVSIGQTQRALILLAMFVLHFIGLCTLQVCVFALLKHGFKSWVKPPLAIQPQCRQLDFSEFLTLLSLDDLHGMPSEPECLKARCSSSLGRQNAGAKQCHEAGLKQATSQLHFTERLSKWITVGPLMLQSKLSTCLLITHFNMKTAAVATNTLRKHQ